jgi:hypothetical protein
MTFGLVKRGYGIEKGMDSLGWRDFLTAGWPVVRNDISSPPTKCRFKANLCHANTGLSAPKCGLASTISHVYCVFATAQVQLVHLIK